MRAPGFPLYSESTSSSRSMSSLFAGRLRRTLSVDVSFMPFSLPLARYSVRFRAYSDT